MTRPIRVSFGSITKVRLTPMPGSRIKKVSDLSTIAMRFKPAQALALSKLLAKAAREGGDQTVDLTGFRKTGQVTVTRPL